MVAQLDRQPAAKTPARLPGGARRILTVAGSVVGAIAVGCAAGVAAQDESVFSGIESAATSLVGIHGEAGPHVTEAVADQNSTLDTHQAGGAAVIRTVSTEAATTPADAAIPHHHTADTSAAAHHAARASTTYHYHPLPDKLDASFFEGIRTNDGTPAVDGAIMHIRSIMAENEAYQIHQAIIDPQKLPSGDMIFPNPAHQPYAGIGYANYQGTASDLGIFEMKVHGLSTGLQMLQGGVVTPLDNWVEVNASYENHQLALLSLGKDYALIDPTNRVIDQTPASEILIAPIIPGESTSTALSSWVYTVDQFYSLNVLSRTAAVTLTFALVPNTDYGLLHVGTPGIYGSLGAAIHAFETRGSGAAVQLKYETFGVRGVTLPVPLT